ncbi:MAG TPA: UPF0158 family protein [Planctomycetota bacterium]|nr:UPF0158 family protein [Planctomycetota bacterium]
MSDKIKVKFGDIEIAMEADPSFEHGSHVNRKTGEVVTITEEERVVMESEEPLEDYPEWLRNSVAAARDVEENPGNYASMPDRFEFNEYDLMRRFAVHQDEKVANRLLRAISGKGAFRYFKDEIRRLNVEDAWYEYRREKMIDLAKAWCEEEGFELAIDRTAPEEKGTNT